jgi:alpha-D-ribose 1-methylphosphonate 5-triphosphate synthase subunit PhnH
MMNPPYTPAEARSRESFLALMWALSYPGRRQNLPAATNSLALIGETLLDLEVSFYTPDAALKPLLAQFGAKALTAETAGYHFYPVMDDSALVDLRAASVGTLLYPDTGATLMIACQFNQGVRMVWQGPGIPGQQAVQIGGVPEAFWHLRESACRFPLGWDIYFVDGQQVIGLPRSVRVEMV